MSQPYFPPSPRDQLLKDFQGKSLHELPTPSAIINVAAVRRNCERMLSACKILNLGWRAHVKTHKTVEVMQLQVGKDDNLPVNLIVSTLAEFEFLFPALEVYKSQGRKVNVLYGLPISPGTLARLAGIIKALGKDSLSLLIDHPAQLPFLADFVGQSGVRPHAYIKIDMGGKRAGVVNDSPQFFELVDAALQAHSRGHLILAGLYSHAGHSYHGDSRTAAIKMMKAELSALQVAAERVVASAGKHGVTDLPSLILSAGASPTALSVQNLFSEDTASSSDGDLALQAEADEMAGLFENIRASTHKIEIHAGVYPLLDLQQLAAHSVSPSRLSWKDMALTVIAEVHSYYPNRGNQSTDEALIGAGSLALGREPCKAYDGMAILTPWGRDGSAAETPKEESGVEDYTGWMVGKVSQEHGILTWGCGHRKAGRGAQGGENKEQDKLEVGQKVRIWPNHACITSSQYGWYFVVDEDEEEKEVVIDVWLRARGW